MMEQQKKKAAKKKAVLAYNQRNLKVIEDKKVKRKCKVTFDITLFAGDEITGFGDYIKDLISKEYDEGIENFKIKEVGHE